MKTSHIVSVLASLGVLAFCWMILPSWIVGIIAFFSIFIAMFFVEILEKDSGQKPKKEVYRFPTSIPAIREPEQMSQNPLEERLPSFNSMPLELSIALYSLTINEAVEQGLIKDLGDENGNFTIYDIDAEPQPHFAVVNGYRISVSRRLASHVKNDDSVMGDLMFGVYKGRSSLFLPEEQHLDFQE